MYLNRLPKWARLIGYSSTSGFRTFAFGFIHLESNIWFCSKFHIYLSIFSMTMISIFTSSPKWFSWVSGKKTSFYNESSIIWLPNSAESSICRLKSTCIWSSSAKFSVLIRLFSYLTIFFSSWNTCIVVPLLHSNF